jgi:GTPase SAR1 family protein
MGKILAKLMKKLSDDGPKRILMLGLENAGKTTILYRMKNTEDFHTVPTVGMLISYFLFFVYSQYISLLFG